MATRGELLGLLLVTLLVMAWSVINPRDGTVWVMEALPVMIAMPLLLATRQRFPLTRLAYYLIVFHALILLVGAHYTYARVPVGNWVADLLELQRNHYDRFAHVAQGFVPAILAREIFIRLAVIGSPRWRFFLVCGCCLAVSALYEIIEWQSAVWGGDSSLDFLGIQGDVWDAQWDMTLALLGSVLSQWWLGGLHDRQLGAVAAVSK